MINLRKLYGRSSRGTSNRQTVKLTVTPETMGALRRHVEFGRGKNGSAFFELSARTMLVLMNDGSDVDGLAAEIQRVVENPGQLARNLRVLASYLEA